MSAAFILVVVITITMAVGAVAASAWGGWWHLAWVIPGCFLLRSVIRHARPGQRRQG